MIVAVMALVATTASAQFKFGGGVTMGTEMGMNDEGDVKAGFGVNVRGLFDISEKFKVSPGFTYFFPGAPEGVDMSAWQLNADAQYHFYSNESISIYGIGGLNYSHMKTEFDTGDAADAIGGLVGDLGDLGDLGGLVDDVFSAAGVSNEVKDNKIGLDLGAGINFGKFYGEVKYDTAFEQVALSVGILFGGN